MNTTKAKLSPLGLGMALGVTWGISVLLMGLLATYLMYGKEFVTAMGNVYVGYEASVVGSFIGGLIAFVDAFIAGVIIGWLYNVFSGCCHKN